MTATPPPAGGPMQKGPIGQAMNPTQLAVLSLVTCGIYSLYWAYKSGEELKQHNGEGLGGAVMLLLTLVVAGWFMIPIEIQKMYEADGRQSPVTAVDGLWLLIPCVGYFLYYPKVQGALNDYWVSKGAAPIA